MMFEPVATDYVYLSALERTMQWGERRELTHSQDLS